MFIYPKISSICHCVPTLINPYTCNTELHTRILILFQLLFLYCITDVTVVPHLLPEALHGNREGGLLPCMGLLCVLFWGPPAGHMSEGHGHLDDSGISHDLRRIAVMGFGGESPRTGPRVARGGATPGVNLRQIAAWWIECGLMVAWKERLFSIEFIMSTINCIDNYNLMTLHIGSLCPRKMS